MIGRLTSVRYEKKCMEFPQTEKLILTLLQNKINFPHNINIHFGVIARLTRGTYTYIK